MAQAADAPLIPAAVWGTQRIVTKWRPKNFQRKVVIMVNVGKPIDLDASHDPDESTERLMARINELLADAQARLCDLLRVPPAEAAHHVAEAPVPFQPARREIPQLIRAAKVL